MELTNENKVALSKINEAVVEINKVIPLFDKKLLTDKVVRNLLIYPQGAFYTLKCTALNEKTDKLVRDINLMPCIYATILPDEYIIIDEESRLLSLHSDAERFINKFYTETNTKTKAFIILCRIAEACNEANAFWKEHYLVNSGGGVSGFIPYCFPSHLTILDSGDVVPDSWEKINSDPNFKP